MTFDEFMYKVLDIFPNAEIGMDNDYQLIVHTGLTHNADEDTVVDLVTEEEPTDV